MGALLRRLEKINASAAAILCVIFLFLLAEGANSAARAALLAVVLIGTLILLVWLSPRGRLERILADNWLSTGAALGFFVWGLISVSPASILHLAPHPLWPAGSANATLSVSPYRTLEGLAAFAGPCAAFMVGAMTNRDSAGCDWSGRWIMLLSALYALIGLQLFFSGASGARLDVAIGSANVAAGLFAFLSLVAAALMTRAARGRLDHDQREAHLPSSLRWADFAVKAPLALGVFVLLFAALLLTASRGGLIAALGAYLAFAVLVWSQNLRGLGLRGGAIAGPLAINALVVTLLFLRGGDDVVERFGLAVEDMELRRTIADAHWRLFLERPIIGHGINTYHELNATIVNADNWRALAPSGSVHNIFIQTLEESGVIGFALFALMLVPLLARAIGRVATRGKGSEWAAAALAAFALLALQGLVDFTLQTPAVAALFAWCLGAWTGKRAHRS